MKFYNPFKAHIIELANNTFYVRRLFVIGWQYFDRTDTYWWESKNNHNVCSALETAQEALNRIKHRDVVKVYQ